MDTKRKNQTEMARELNVSRMTIWRAQKVKALAPELVDDVSAGEISTRKALAIARNDTRVQMNIDVEPWVRDAFKALAHNSGLTLSEFISPVALSLTDRHIKLK